MVTIKDVAKKAGVSIAAVSYALNGKGGVKEETKRRVLQIAEEMGYIPNSLAQGLLLKKTHVIGVVIPDISNTYTANFIKYLEMYARKNGFFLLISTLFNSSESEIDVFNKLIAKNVDGFIITPGAYEEAVYKQVCAKMNKRNIPYIFANINFPGIKSSFVVPDLEEGEYQLTRSLLEMGFRDIAFAGGSRDFYTSAIRYKGFRQALDDFGLTHDETRYIDCGNKLDFKDGYRTISEYLNRYSLPEVFVALNDSMAYGIIKALKELGLKVPENVGVAGFDDIEMPTVDTVPLTTVRIPVEELARLCIEVMKETEGKKILKQFLLSTEVVIRQSTQYKKSGAIN